MGGGTAATTLSGSGWNSLEVRAEMDSESAVALILRSTIPNDHGIVDSGRETGG